MSSHQLSSLFPLQTPSYILSFQFSSWYSYFSHLTIKSTAIRPLPQEFRDYLDADSVFIPEGSEDVPAESTLSDNVDGDEGEDDSNDLPPTFAFPQLDKQIRDCVNEYGAVFPKLNFSSPKDASWILPASAPLKCTSPSEVYLLLKSSDFITHDLSAASVFDGCTHDHPLYELELVLRKWHPVDRSRELRCFVRENILLGISQRDNNYYEYLNEPTTHKLIISTVQRFWEANIQKTQYWISIQDYTFDLLLTRDLSRGHILDFNPYAPRTDPLLFTYDELSSLLDTRIAISPMEDRCTSSDPPSPEFRIIDSRAHPAATANVPAYQHNMVPFEALNMSTGRDIEAFANLWKDEIRRSTTE